MSATTQTRPVAPAATRLPRIKPPRIREASEGRRALGSVSFVLLVFALLAGGLVALLMVNNTLAAGSFEQARLRADLILLGEQQQSLTREVERASSPTQLRAAAKLLGMVPAATTTYVDPATGAILGTPIASGTTSLPAAPDASDTTTTVPDPAAGDGATGPDAAASDGDSAAATASDSSTSPVRSGGDGASTDPPTTAYDRAVASGGTP